MNCNVTLTADEFKTIHNALCELDNVKAQLENVLNKDLFVKLVKASNGIRKGLEGAYEQESKAFDTKHEHYSQVKQELGLDSIWSIYEVDNLSDRHPFEGATQVVYKDHWGKGDIVVPVNGSTWAALYVAGNAAIRDSGDSHHVFIEQFKQSSINPQILFMTTGS